MLFILVLDVLGVSFSFLFVVFVFVFVPVLVLVLVVVVVILVVVAESLGKTCQQTNKIPMLRLFSASRVFVGKSCCA